MAQAITEEIILEEFKEKGVVLLSWYRKNKIRVVFNCVSCGELLDRPRDNFLKQRPICKKCSLKKEFQVVPSNKLTYETIKIEFEKQGATLLATEYINNRQKLPFICKCGNKHSLAWDKVANGSRQIWCKKCAYPSGESHNNWNPNLTEEDRLKSRPSEVHVWYRQVFKEDDYTCQLSGERGGKLSAHHIYTFAHFKDCRYNIENGITIKKSLHALYHNLYGIEASTRFEFEEFCMRYYKGEFEEDVK